MLIIHDNLGYSELSVALGLRKISGIREDIKFSIRPDIRLTGYLRLSEDILTHPLSNKISNSAS